MNLNKRREKKKREQARKGERDRNHVLRLYEWVLKPLGLAQQYRKELGGNEKDALAALRWSAPTVDVDPAVQNPSFCTAVINEIRGLFDEPLSPGSAACRVDWDLWNGALDDGSCACLSDWFSIYPSLPDAFEQLGSKGISTKVRAYLQRARCAFEKKGEELY